MARRELLQLGHTYQPDKHTIAGFYVSEKLDGTRCFWDGGLSRGCVTAAVPYASVLDPKTGRRKAKIKPVATGLWSRYGNPIMAPDWFLNRLPCCPLDGELWAGRGNFQLCRSICAGDAPDERFDQIQYAVYSTPPLPQVFCDGEIKNANMLREINRARIETWVRDRATDLPDFVCVDPTATFDDELLFLREMIPSQDDRVFMHQQFKLPHDEAAAKATADAFLQRVLDKGGEGIVLRDPAATWRPKRVKSLLKYKPFEDAEAVVTGFVAGKEGKQGNVLGKIGALKFKWGNVEFEIGSGMTMAQRELHGSDARLHAVAHPGDELPSGFHGKHFQLGQVITFKYRELSDDGVPKEARYWRKRDAVE
ncbi:MAG: hypothetical protein DWQ31_16815 [Planctomycetota bacterium]|nr:MAG: hypothetical protein DWQ31_16815 [Planctomycetota bacterium]REJ92016.1 MAG: hypothetical protein DWQ35_12765 [Planctomycetota bacterium]REK28552.1 MAG: hypothetical protein DWQ42_04355 [Planctomycetota bacterium]REK39167.1 MAG: hypothetical protein DWQ46_17940 [Planctomycetota bacterium]